MRACPIPPPRGSVRALPAWPLDELCKPGARSSSGCGPCTDPGQVRQAGRRVRPVSQGHPRAGTRSRSWGLGPTRRATRGPGKTGLASVAGAFRRRVGRPCGIKGAATAAAAARSAAGPRGPGRGRARTVDPELPATSSFSLHARRVQWFLTVQQFCSAIVKCLGPLDPARNGGGDDSDGAAHDGQGLLGGGRG